MHQINRLASVMKLLASVTLAAITLAVDISAYADVDAGAESFDAHCAECHSLKPGKNKKGPSLAGIAGRKSASITGFSYSEDLTASGLTWTNDKLDTYVANPKTLVPGGKMKFKGLADAKERADLIEFLSEQK